MLVVMVLTVLPGSGLLNRHSYRSDQCREVVAFSRFGHSSHSLSELANAAATVASRFSHTGMDTCVQLCYTLAHE